MNQTQHIFAKDARRFWAEIALSVAITAAFVFLGPSDWTGKYEPQKESLMTLAALVTGLVPVSWWVAITRVVHEERLVGDTQFWITRPYEWTSLLAAKLAFVLAFLYVPLLLAQLALLAQAGFAPLAYLPGLLYNLLLITCLVALPLAAIASVTSSFARMTLTLLGILVGILAFFMFASFADSYWTSGEAGSLGNRISIALLFGVLAIAIVLQYARRTVWSSRRLLIALPLLLLAVGFSASKYEQAQIDRIYPPAQAGTLIRLVYSPEQASYETSSFEASPRAQIPIKIRLAESGVGDGRLVLIDAVRVELKAPDGSHWESDWRRVGGYKFLPGELTFSPTFLMPIAEFRRFQGTPLRVHLVVAISSAQAGKVTNLPLAPQRFSVPDFGVCSPKHGWTGELGRTTGIACVFALHQPPLTYISTHWSDTQCSGTASPPDGDMLGTAWVGALDHEPAQLGFSPVVDPSINLSNSENKSGRGENRLSSLCPGTPITFTRYERVGRMQTSVDIPSFSLPKYSVTGNMIIITQ